MYKLYGHVYRWAVNRAVVNLGFGNKCGVDVSRVPIEELVAVVSGTLQVFSGGETPSWL